MLLLALAKVNDSDSKFRFARASLRFFIPSLNARIVFFSLQVCLLIDPVFGALRPSLLSGYISSEKQPQGILNQSQKKFRRDSNVSSSSMLATLLVGAWHTSPVSRTKTRRTSSLTPRYVNSTFTCTILNREGITYTDILQIQLVRFIQKVHLPRPLPATNPVCFAPITTPLIK